MAQKKATVRKKSTSSTSKSRSRSAAASKKPIRREVGALICFFLAVFGTLGYFKVVWQAGDFMCIRRCCLCHLIF